MLEILDRSTGNALAVKASGLLSDADYKNIFIPRLEQILARHERIRAMVCFAEDFRGWQPKAAWDDTHFGLKHRKEFAKLCVVGADHWVEWGFNVGAHFIGAQVRDFSAGQEEDAWQWLTS